MMASNLGRSPLTYHLFRRLNIRVVLYAIDAVVHLFGKQQTAVWEHQHPYRTPPSRGDARINQKAG